MNARLAHLESLIRRDPGGRGVASYRRAMDSRLSLRESTSYAAKGDNSMTLLAEGELATAADSLAEGRLAVGITTGFCILTSEGVFAETDGPPGALVLANVLLELGAEVMLISDAYGVPVLEAGCDFLGLPQGMVFEFPFEEGSPDSPLRTSNDPSFNPISSRYVEDFFAGNFGRRLTHLIAIERVGPGHTADSLATNDPAMAEQFARENPPETRNRCYNMRGVSITAHTGKTHLLFERAEYSRKITTIGIGDGGNEIGMGKLPWSDVAAAVASGNGGKIACRIATDHLILAGVSNWGGYALAAAVAGLCGRSDLLRGQSARIGPLIEHLVRETPCVDGVTKRREATVDGMPLDEYLKTPEAVFDAT